MDDDDDHYIRSYNTKTAPRPFFTLFVLLAPLSRYLRHTAAVAVVGINYSCTCRARGDQEIRVHVFRVYQMERRRDRSCVRAPTLINHCANVRPTT